MKLTHIVSGFAIVVHWRPLDLVDLAGRKRQRLPASEAHDFLGGSS